MKDLPSYYDELKVRLTALVEEGEVKKLPTGTGASSNSPPQGKVRPTG